MHCNRLTDGHLRYPHNVKIRAPSSRTPSTHYRPGAPPRDSSSTSLSSSSSNSSSSSSTRSTSASFASDSCMIQSSSSLLTAAVSDWTFFALVALVDVFSVISTSSSVLLSGLLFSLSSPTSFFPSAFSSSRVLLLLAFLFLPEKKPCMEELEPDDEDEDFFLADLDVLFCVARQCIHFTVCELDT